MKLAVLFLVLCGVAANSAEKLIASSSRQLSRREHQHVKRLVKRQLLSNDPNCDPRACAVPNCGKDFVAARLAQDCCEKCVPWEYAESLGIRVQRPGGQQQQQPQGSSYDPYRQPQQTQDPYGQPQQTQDPYRPPVQPSYDPYAQPPYYQPQPAQPQPPYVPINRVDVYIFGPDAGARVSEGSSIYFDCEVVSPYNQNLQPRWTRSGGQPLPYTSQSTPLPGNRKIVRMTLNSATAAEGGRYECSAGTGNPADAASIDLQVLSPGSAGYQPPPQPGAQPRYPPSQPDYNQQPQQPQYPQDPWYNQQPQQPQQPSYPGYPQYPQNPQYNYPGQPDQQPQQPDYYNTPGPPQPSPQPGDQDQRHPDQHDQHTDDQQGGEDAGDEDIDEGADDEGADAGDQADAATTPSPATPDTNTPAAGDAGGEADYEADIDYDDEGASKKKK